MKKLLALLTMTAVLFGTCGTLAELPDLGDGLPNVQFDLITILAPIPDPAESLGSVGTAYQTAYDYNGIRYDLYLYPIPDPMQPFVDAYSAAAEAAGYQVMQGAEQGNSALFVSAGDIRAMLLLEYQGYMLLMVPEGADFTLRDAVQPTEPPVIRRNYITLDYNGYHYEGDSSSTLEIKMSTFDVREASMFYSFDGTCPFSYIYMVWPAYAHAGDTFRVTKADGEGSVYGSPRKDCYVYFTLQKEELIFFGKLKGKYYDYSTSKDYFTLTITRAEETDDGYLFEGDIECHLASAEQRYGTEIVNCHFSACEGR